MQLHNVMLSLMRFTFSHRIDLIHLLQRLSITLPFDSTRADLS